MKKYEYKFVEVKGKIGLDFSKKYLIQKNNGMNGGWRAGDFAHGEMVS